MTITAEAHTTPSPAPRAGSPVAVDRLQLALREPLVKALDDLDHVRGLAPWRHRPLTRRQSAYRLIRSLSQYTSAVETSLYPRLTLIPGGEIAVRRDRELSHSLLILLRKLRGTLQGDYLSRGSHADVAEELSNKICSLLAHRMEWLSTLQFWYVADEHRNLAQRLESAQVHAPSRPHPYSPTSGLTGRIARRFLVAVDGFMDECDSQA